MAEYPDGTRDCPRCLARGRHPLACNCPACLQDRHGGRHDARAFTISGADELCPHCAHAVHKDAMACLAEMELFMRRHLAFADYLIERFGPDELLAA